MPLLALRLSLGIGHSYGSHREMCLEAEQVE